MKQTFWEYYQEINEDTFKFVAGNDQDYTGHPSQILVFSETEPKDYQIQGKTHGQMSHAIKHLDEYDKPYVNSVLIKAKELIKNFLQRRPQYFCKIWDEIRGFSEVSGMDAVEQCDLYTILNTLDLVNDKNQLKSPFTKIDGQLKKFGVELEHRYNQIINDKMSVAVDLDAIKNGKQLDAIKRNRVINFNTITRNGKKSQVWIDFKDQSLIIGDYNKNGTDQVRSMFRLNHVAGTDKAAVIKQFYTKGFKAINPDVDDALRAI